MPDKINIKLNGKNIEAEKGTVLEKLFSQHLESKEHWGGCQGRQPKGIKLPPKEDCRVEPLICP